MTTVPLRQKICSQCKANKPVTEFYSKPNGKPLHICKQCRQDRQRKVYLRRADYYKEWATTYHKKNAVLRQQISNSWRARNPEKELAGQALRNAIAAGRIKRAQICSKCGSQKNIQAHHPDYSQPFQVEWFCSQCHAAHHRLEREKMRHHA
jgi:transcription elongation factor Elf1